MSKGLETLLFANRVSQTKAIGKETSTKTGTGPRTDIVMKPEPASAPTSSLEPRPAPY